VFLWVSCSTLVASDYCRTLRSSEYALASLTISPLGLRKESKSTNPVNASARIAIPAIERECVVSRHWHALVLLVHSRNFRVHENRQSQSECVHPQFLAGHRSFAARYPETLCLFRLASSHRVAFETPHRWRSGMARDTLALLVPVVRLGAAAEVYGAEFPEAQNLASKKILNAVLFRFSRRRA